MSGGWGIDHHCPAPTDRDDIFLDLECRLVRYAPPGWAHSTHHIPFTLFFRVKYYVENVRQLSQSFTWHLYYLQLRKDLMGETRIDIQCIVYY